MYNDFDIIKSPVVTEKSTMLSEQGKYLFDVHKTANKNSLARAVKNVFKVDIKSVNVMNIKGKQKRFKGVTGRRSDVKRAIVTLKKGDTIDLSGGIK